MNNKRDLFPRDSPNLISPISYSSLPVQHPAFSDRPVESDVQGRAGIGLRGGLSSVFETLVIMLSDHIYRISSSFLLLPLSRWRFTSDERREMSFSQWLIGNRNRFDFCEMGYISERAEIKSKRTRLASTSSNIITSYDGDNYIEKSACDSGLEDECLPRRLTIRAKQALCLTINAFLWYMVSCILPYTPPIELYNLTYLLI